MVVKLLVQNAGSTLSEVTLRRPRTVVGRKKGCKLRIKSSQVSRIHCSLVVHKNQLTVKDLSSTNGTAVNGLAVSTSELKAGDRLVVGPIEFMVQIDGQPPSPAASIELAGESAFITGKDELVFVTSDDSEAVDDPVDDDDGADDLDDLIVPTDGATKLDIASLAASMPPAQPADAANFLIDNDEPREKSAYGLAGDGNVEPPEGRRPPKRPKRRK